MKLVTKIAILIGFIVCVSSCQKEKLPVPGSPDSQVNSSNLRVSHSSDSSSSNPPVIKDDSTGNGDIVGGGDDDKDGGGKEKPKK